MCANSLYNSMIRHHESNLMSGALSNKNLDKAFNHVYPARITDHPNVRYAHYINFFLVFTDCRRQLRRLVKKMHHVMHQLKFKLAINKTFVGNVEREFDFLGYRFGRHGLTGMVVKTVFNFIERLIKLYELGGSLERVDAYVHRWICWCRVGLA